MGNGASSSQGGLPAYDQRDIRSSVEGEQHDWQPEQAVASRPETLSLQLTRKSYIPPIISGTDKATEFKLGRYIHRVHPNISRLKI